MSCNQWRWFRHIYFMNTPLGRSGIFAVSKHTLASTFSRIRTRSLLTLAVLALLGWYSIRETNAHSGGITGQTQKTTNTGCYCHCNEAQSSTTVTLACSSGSSPLTAIANTTYDFTITVANSSEVDGGCDIATYSGNGLTAGSGLYASGGELTHSSPKSFGGNGYCTWSFTYTAGSSEGWDTIYATGNAVNGDGSDDNGNWDDLWNWAPKFIIHTVTQPVRMSLSRTTIALGKIRVGNRASDSLTVISNGEAAITISSSGMKNGAPFSSYPTTTDRSLNPGSTEIDSVIFAPTARGTFSDSLIFITNSDTLPEQRMGAYVSGQGIQAIFDAPNGTNLSFGNLRADRTAQQTFSFSNSGDDTLFLQTPSISGSGFSIVTGLSTLAFPPNQSGSVVVQFAPTSAQSYSGSLSFTASNGVSAPTVSLSGTGILPQIQVANSEALGSIRVGQTLQGGVAIKNIGTDTLHLSNISLTQPSSRFSLGGYSSAVNPGGTDTVHLSYTPNAERADTATLTFSTDDPTDSAVAVTIIGSGTLPHMLISENGDTENLGQVKIYSSVFTDIAVSNNGAAVLHITSASAGPTPFGVEVSPDTVSSGTSSNILVGFSPTMTGAFNGKLVVHGDDPNNPSDTVYLTGTGINSALSIDPGSINFGSVPVHASVIDTIMLSDSGTANVNIYNVQLLPSVGAFEILGEPPTEVTAGGSAIIVLSFKPDSDVNYSGSITLTTDDPSATTRTININGTGITDPFTVTPSMLDFGEVPAMKSVTDTISLDNEGTSIVNISKYQLSPASSVFSIVGTPPDHVNSNGTASLIVLFTPDSAGNYDGAITMTTNDASDPSRIISLTGTGIKGSLALSPAQIDFGTVPIGHDSSIRVALRNVGSASVTIDSVELKGSNPSAFSYGAFSAPTTLAANDSISFSVSFDPTSSGSYSASIRLVLEDGTKINLPLQGISQNTASVLQDNAAFASLSISLSPNPAGNSVYLHTTLGESAEAALSVFDEAGKAVIVRSLGMLSQGQHDILITTESLSIGTYFVRLSSGNFATAQAKLIIDKK